jgi:hypothetical protein
VTRPRFWAWLFGGPGVVGWDMNESFSVVGSVGHDGVNPHSPCQRPRIVAESLLETEAGIVTTAEKAATAPVWTRREALEQRLPATTYDAGTLIMADGGIGTPLDYDEADHFCCRPTTSSSGTPTEKCAWTILHTASTLRTTAVTRQSKLDPSGKPNLGSSTTQASEPSS